MWNPESAAVDSVLVVCRDEIREFTLAVVACLNWGYHIGSHAWRGLLRLPQPSPWQQHPPCLQLAFSHSLISNSDLKWTAETPSERPMDKWKYTLKMFCSFDSYPCGAFQIYCILTITPVCIIWADKANQAETIWTSLAFMKPFALLYCSALLCKQTLPLTHICRCTAHTHTYTLRWPSCL